MTDMCARAINATMGCVLLFTAGAAAQEPQTPAERTDFRAGPTMYDDLMAFVFRIKALLDVFSGLLAACTVMMTVLIVLLSMRIRRREMETLHQIGCGRSVVARIYGYEVALLAGFGIMLAALATAAALLLLPDLVRTL